MPRPCNADITHEMLRDPKLPDYVTAVRQLVAFVEERTPLGSLPLLVGHNLNGEEAGGQGSMVLIWAKPATVGGAARVCARPRTWSMDGPFA